MLDGAEYSSTSEYSEDFNTSLSKRKKCKNKKRFSDDQIRSLEVTFEHETKLEPRKKNQLAKELGLQPRQVAIWFQNKRARWKSKQIEKDYSLLLASYNNLASQFQSLKKDKKTLIIQLQKLKKNEMDEKTTNNNKEERAGNMSSSTTDGESDYTKIDHFNMNIPISKELEVEGMLSISDDDDSSMKTELLGFEDHNDDELLKMAAAAGGDHSSLTSAEDWQSLDSEHLINHPTDHTYQWWDFWS